MSKIVRYAETIYHPGTGAVMERRPMLMACTCGAKLELWDSWANDCDRCGREYNGSGQELAPRRQWGEETGEQGLW